MAILTFCLVLFGCADAIHQWSAAEINYATRECLGREVRSAFRERFCNCEVNTLASHAEFKNRERARNTPEIENSVRSCRTRLEEADPAVLPPPASIQVEEPTGPRRRPRRRPQLEVERGL
ncbi:MAG: hypothetical protein R3B54_15370 [Bdellovibrionota bacterium]